MAEEKDMAQEKKSEGRMDQAKGKAKEMFGKVIGNEQMQAEGKAEQMKGKGKEVGGKAKEKIDEASR